MPKIEKGAKIKSIKICENLESHIIYFEAVGFSLLIIFRCHNIGLRAVGHEVHVVQRRERRARLGRRDAAGLSWARAPHRRRRRLRRRVDGQRRLAVVVVRWHVAIGGWCCKFVRELEYALLQANNAFMQMRRAACQN